MKRFVKLPLIFLFVGSLLGVFLRWQPISPTPGVNYTYLLHGHSHIMFLGWIFNVLLIAFVSNHIPETQQRFFRIAFYMLQVLIIGMSISFPIQGYGFYSILFSTLHTFIAFAFIFVFFKRTKHITSISSYCAKIGLIFFTLSTIGPFSLGYFMSAGLGHSQWYYFSIYYYLHFQYNGFFLFGILSLFFQILERNLVSFSSAKAKSFLLMLAILCIPTYLLSTLWAKPGYILNIVGGIAALLQLYALGMFIWLLMPIRKDLQKKLKPISIFLSIIITLAFALKLILQCLSALPSLAQMAYDLRPITIAYLHLVLVGVISLYLLVWYVEANFLNEQTAKKSITLFVSAFAGMEICLVLSPWWIRLFGSGFLSPSISTFIFASVLPISCLLLIISAYRKT